MRLAHLGKCGGERFFSNCMNPHGNLELESQSLFDQVPLSPSLTRLEKYAKSIFFFTLANTVRKQTALNQMIIIYTIL